MGVLAVKGSDDTGADHAAVGVVRVGQKQDVLGGAAAGRGVAPAEVRANADLQIVHDVRKAPFGQGTSVLSGDGDQSDVGNFL